MAIANQSTSENEINQLNLAMRQTPWYQDYFKSRGLDPNMVKLNDRQKMELTQLAHQNGYQLGDRMKIDGAGNINQKGGFAGMPTWAKVAIAAAAVAGTGGALGAAGVGPMAGMFSGGGAPLSTLASTPLSTSVAGYGVAPSLIGSTAAGVGSMGGTAALSGTAAAAKTGGSVISRLMSGKNTQNLADAGSLMSRFANDEATNRLNNNDLRTEYERNRGYLTQNHDNIQLNAAANRRNDEADAIKKLSQTSYIKSGGAPFDASKVQLSGGRSLPSFNFPRAPISDAMKLGASDLEATLLNRLKDGSYKPTDLASYLPSDPATNGAMNRGAGEQIGRWGSIATTGLGLLNNYFGK